MVGINYLLCLVRVEIVFSIFVPWYLNESVEICLLDAVFHRHRIESLQLAEFFLESLFYVISPFFLAGLLFQIIDILYVRIVAQLLLNGFKLLVQNVIALLFVDVNFNLLFDLFLDFKHFEFIGHVFHEGIGLVCDVLHLKHLLFVFDADVQIVGYVVDDEVGLVDVLKCEIRFVRDIRRFLDNLFCEALQCAYLSVELSVFLQGSLLCDRSYSCDKIGFTLNQFLEMEFRFALYDGSDASVRHVEDL